MSNKKLYLFYFMYGMINSIAIQMLPLVMSYKGFIPSQVAVILSFVFLAALFQPLIGVLTKAKFGSQRMLKMLLVVLIVTSLIIYSLTLYRPMLIIVLIFSIARLAISPIYDSFATMAIQSHGINYGLVRSGASLGFGIGMAIYTIIANLLGLEYSASFVVVTVLGVIGLVVVSMLPNQHAETTNDNKPDVAPNLTKAALLIAMYMLYFGALNIRLSYASTFYVEFGYTTTFISLATFFMVIPEIIFLPLYNRLFARVNKMLLMYLAIIIAILQMILYITFTGSPLILLFASMFNGLQIMIFFPTYFGLLQSSLGPRNSSLGFVMNTTLMSLFVGIFNLVVLRPLIITYNSMIPVYTIVIVVQLCAFLPLFIYHFKFERKR